MDMKRFFLYFITIAALALAGCGGGGSGSSGPSLQDQLDTALADLATAEDQRDAAHMAMGVVRMVLGLMDDADHDAIAGAIMGLNANSADLVAVADALGMPGATQAMLVAEVERLQAEDIGPVEAQRRWQTEWQSSLPTKAGDFGPLSDSRRPGKDMTANATEEFNVTLGGVDMPATTTVGTGTTLDTLFTVDTTTGTRQ